MKKWKCPNCYEEKETEDDIIMAFCNCGEFMLEVKEEKK